MAESTDAQVLIGQLTDSHVLAADDEETVTFVDNNGRLADAVARINAEVPALDVVLATGDLVNDAREDQYDALVDLLAPLRPPLLPLPGNHDDRDVLRGRFTDVPWVDADHASWVVEVGGVRVVGLDSTMPGHHGGVIDTERAAWLGDVLSADHDGLTLLAMHHPPFVSGIWWMDQYGFPGLDLLGDVLTAHPVDRIVCGHLHRPMASTIAGVPAAVAMSTVQHVELDLRPPGDGAVAVIDDPVGYQIHQVVGPRLVTHSRFIRNGAPIVPDWADEFG